jgi:hypothetical protein
VQPLGSTEPNSGNSADNGGKIMDPQLECISFATVDIQSTIPIDYALNYLFAALQAYQLHGAVVKMISNYLAKHETA